MTKDISGSGYIAGVSYITTNRDDTFFDPTSGKDIGKGTLLLSLSKTF